MGLLKWCVVGIGLIASLQARPIDAIALEDRPYLTAFFKGLLAEGAFALTLFDQKPAAPFDYPSSLLLLMEEGRAKRKWLLQKKGWKIWERYRSLFEDRFLFLRLGDDYSALWFINKKIMNAILAQYKDFFQEYCASDPTQEELSSFLAKAFTPQFSKDQFHIALGLLLGYPLQSCLDFQERLQIEDTLAFFPYAESSQEIDQKEPRDLLDGYPLDILQRTADFQKNFKFRCYWSAHENPFFPTKPSGYLCFEPIEDPNLKGIKEKIAKLYNSNTFLEDFIELLVGT